MFSKKFMMAVFVLLLLVISFITQTTARYILTEFHLLAFNHQLQKQTVSLQSVEEGLGGCVKSEWSPEWMSIIDKDQYLWSIENWQNLFPISWVRIRKVLGSQWVLTND